MNALNNKDYDYDLIIIGSGPAGMAAAVTASDQGLMVAVIDEQALPGGQIYRQVGEPVLDNQAILGSDYYYGKQLVERFNEVSIKRISHANVWQISASDLCFTQDGCSHRINFRRLLLATGSQERPVPFPGWTLPGVMTCGAAQIMLKSSGLAPSAPLVLAGSGPLLLLVTCQLQRAGIDIEAVLDTTPKGHYIAALKEFGGALKGWRALLKGLRLLSELKRSGVNYLTGISSLQASADSHGQLNQVYFEHRGQQRSIECTTLLIHQGVVPNVQLSRSMELDHLWDEQQQCWRPTINAWGKTSLDSIFIAGDGSGIGGAIVAELQGELSALAICTELGQMTNEKRDILAAPLQANIDRELAIRPFLDQLYRPATEFLRPSDDTIVCRCEEVTAGEIRRIALNGCAGPNQAKAFIRAGMGPCQGRLCGLTVSQLIAEARDVPVTDVGYYRIRSPIKPITLGELASVDTSTVSASNS